LNARVIHSSRASARCLKIRSKLQRSGFGDHDILPSGNDVHKLDEDVVEAAPDGHNVESRGRLLSHQPQVSMVQPTDGVEPQEALY
jgi:hypothetical protein